MTMIVKTEGLCLMDFPEPMRMQRMCSSIQSKDL